MYEMKRPKDELHINSESQPLLSARIFTGPKLCRL